MKPSVKKEEPKKAEKSGFTGVARSVICTEYEGFVCYKIVTLDIENGEVTKTDYSQPYMSFELTTKMETLNDKSFAELTRKWKEGVALSRFEGV